MCINIISLSDFRRVLSLLAPQVYGNGEMALYTCRLVFLHLRVSALSFKIIIHFIQMDMLLFLIINDVGYYVGMQLFVGNHIEINYTLV